MRGSCVEQGERMGGGKVAHSTRSFMVRETWLGHARVLSQRRTRQARSHERRSNGCARGVQQRSSQAPQVMQTAERGNHGWVPARSAPVATHREPLVVLAREGGKRAQLLVRLRAAQHDAAARLHSRGGAPRGRTCSRGRGRRPGYVRDEQLLCVQHDGMHARCRRCVGQGANTLERSAAAEHTAAHRPWHSGEPSRGARSAILSERLRTFAAVQQPRS